MPRVTFPFTAFVNQEELKLGLILNVINPKIGGLLIKGAKGTGKSSFAYALPAILPAISVVKDCPFNCNPSDPTDMCDDCRKKGKLESEERTMRVITLPLGTTEDRLIGSINIEEVIGKGIKALQPGVLAMANQNILYIDEINLLPDHITDDILDAAASGWNTIEREGFSIVHPARFVLIGSMNPEEGELRPQILDRLALSVDMQMIPDENERTEVVKRNLSFENDPAGFNESFAAEQKALKEKIVRAKTLLADVGIAESLLWAIAAGCARLEIDGMRPDVIITKAAMTIAAYEGRTTVAEGDIVKAAVLVLSHRTRKGGFQPPATKEEIEGTFSQTAAQNRGKGEGVFKTGGQVGKKKRIEEIVQNSEEIKVIGKFKPAGAPIVDIQKIIKAFKNFTQGFHLEPPAKKVKVRAYLGKHAQTQASTDRGRRINAVPYQSGHSSLAIVPTVETALVAGHYAATTRRVRIAKSDLMMWQLRSKISMTIILVLDASSSTRLFLPVLSQAIGLIYRDAYRKKDKIGLVVFKDNEGQTLIQPTRNYQLVLGTLLRIEPSGLTPLASGLEKAFITLKEEKRRDRNMLPCVVLVSDCFPEPLTHKFQDLFEEPAYREVIRVAHIYERAKVPIVIINPYHGFVGTVLKPGTKLGMMVAEISKGRYVGISEHETDEELASTLSRRGFIKKHSKEIAGVFDDLRAERLQAG